jgi:lysyl-tRNA synthetase, class II
MHHLSEQEIVRRESLDKIRALGINPYPAEMFDISNLSDEIKENYCEEILEDGTKNRMNFHDVSVAGRLMAKREAGKALFLNIQDYRYIYAKRKYALKVKIPHYSTKLS